MPLNWVASHCHVFTASATLTFALGLGTANSLAYWVQSAVLPKYRYSKVASRICPPPG